MGYLVALNAYYILLYSTTFRLWKYVLNYFDFNVDILTGKCSPYFLLVRLKKTMSIRSPYLPPTGWEANYRPISTPALIPIYPYLALITLTKNVGNSIKRKENMK